MPGRFIGIYQDADRSTEVEALVEEFLPFCQVRMKADGTWEYLDKSDLVKLGRHLRRILKANSNTQEDFCEFPASEAVKRLYNDYPPPTYGGLVVNTIGPESFIEEKKKRLSSREIRSGGW
jgi:hypothetical protein